MKLNGQVEVEQQATSAKLENAPDIDYRNGATTRVRVIPSDVLASALCDLQLFLILRMVLPCGEK